MKELIERLQALVRPLYEMTNLRSSTTNLPMTIWVYPEIRKLKHNLPRLKFQNNYSSHLTDVKDLVPISIEDNPKILVKVNLKISQEDLATLKSWIRENKEILLQFYNQEIDAGELIKGLK